VPVYFICLKHRAIERIELFRVELRGPLNIDYIFIYGF
jgi:hypothetical protein